MSEEFSRDTPDEREEPQVVQDEQEAGALKSNNETAIPPEREEEASGSLESYPIEGVEEEQPQQAETEKPEQDESAKQPPERKGKSRRRSKKRKKRKKNAPEVALQGRLGLCHRIDRIVHQMLKMVMTRIASCYPRSTKGLSDEELRRDLVASIDEISGKRRIVEVMTALDPDRNRRLLKGIIVFDVLMQQERYALPSTKLNEEVIHYEEKVVRDSQPGNLLDAENQDPTRLSAYETYNVVLDAAWRHEDQISVDEANLLAELRRRLNITLREHRLLEAAMERFPKQNCELHTFEEIEDAKRQLQREGILWTFRDENGEDIDCIPIEIMRVVLSEMKDIELQDVNYERLLSNRAWNKTDFVDILQENGLDTRGRKAELAQNMLASRLKPSEVLHACKLPKLQTLCREVGLVSYGNKADVVQRLIEFYDNLTFEPPQDGDQDERAKWYAAYELLAARKYSELKAQGLIEKQEDVESAFEKATEFLFERRFQLETEPDLPVKSADGKIYLRDGNQVVLWDCKTNERTVNLQDHLEPQFDGYMRAEARNGCQVLYFLVIGPAFTEKSGTLARKFKMATNWDVPMITASALKRMAERWYAANDDKPFPLGLLNLTEVIDDDRADQLLSVVL